MFSQQSEGYGPSHRRYSQTIPNTSAFSPPSYASYEVVPDGAPSERTISPPPQGRLAQYLYYCLYQGGGGLLTYQPFGEDADQSNEMGRLRIKSLPPPRNIFGLKRSIARLEGFNATDIEEIFLTSDSGEGEEDAVRLNLSTGAPGCDPESPIYVIIADGAPRGQPTSENSQSSGPNGRSLTGVPPPASNILIHKNVIWNVDASGFAEPICAPEKSWQITGPGEPPGWVQAYLKPGIDKVAMFLFRKAEDVIEDTSMTALASTRQAADRERSDLDERWGAPPEMGKTNSRHSRRKDINDGWIDAKRSDRLLIDRRKTITDSEGRKFYRTIFVKHNRIVYVDVQNVRFEP